jgi:hypothetical protein
MRSRQGAAMTLAALALALGAAACGGGSGAGTTTSSPQAVAQAHHWRVGILRLRHTMQQALDGISLIFSSQESIVRLQARHSATRGRLAGYESVLAGCSSELQQMGRVPLPFRLSSKYARRACHDLERGGRMVEEALVLLDHNASIDPLDPLGAASDPLGTGQSELSTAARALAEPT